jgi:hypothetical protein
MRVLSLKPETQHQNGSKLGAHRNVCLCEVTVVPTSQGDPEATTKEQCMHKPKWGIPGTLNCNSNLLLLFTIHLCQEKQSNIRNAPSSTRNLKLGTRTELNLVHTGRFASVK